MADIVIGIDLGTTNSCAAYCINGKVKILENEEGGRIKPSTLFIRKYRKTIVGRDARPECGVCGKKTTADKSDEMVWIENESIKETTVELCAAILSKIRYYVEAWLGKTVDKAVITVPANFDINQRGDTLAAAKKAGLTVLKLLNEPTAAALSYYFQNYCEEENYALVYDLGGGTFDVAILKRNSNNIDIIAVGGDNHLGGQDFDNLLIDYVFDELKKKYDYNPLTEKKKNKRLQTLCEEAKKTLSVAQDTTIVLNGYDCKALCTHIYRVGMSMSTYQIPDRQLSFRRYETVKIPLTRKQFESMADKHFKRTIDIIDKCLKSCNLEKSAIKEVILSGGSTRIPKIQEMLSNYFDNRCLNKFRNSDKCVAEGAALQAAMLSNNPKQKIGLEITDVTPLSLGVGHYVNLMEKIERIKFTNVASRVAPLSLGVGGLANFMTVLIEKNTPLPVSVSIPCVNVCNQQKSMSFDIYEGERLDVRKNYHLATMRFSNITPAPLGKCNVTVTMTLDQNDILTVELEEKYRNNVKTWKTFFTRRLRSDSEVKNALKDAEDHKEEDERFGRFARLKQYVLRYCMGIIYNLENKGLVHMYENEYELCKKVETKVENMEMKDEAELTQLQEEIKRRCDPIWGERDFQFLPTLWM